MSEPLVCVDLDQLRGVLAKLQQPHDDLDAVRRELWGLPCVTIDGTFGEYGVAEKLWAFGSAWRDETDMTAGAVGQTVAAVDEAIRKYTATDHDNARRIATICHD